jgi:hypothetical protein
VICDNTDGKKLTRLLRAMRRNNPVPHHGRPGYRQIPLRCLVEDPVFRDSRNNYFVQAADLAAFLLYQKQSPNKYMRKNGGGRLFNILGPVLCRKASRTDQEGIVRL